MSTGLGLICQDGIVLGSDSLVTKALGPEVTRANQGKPFGITDRIQLIGTGGYTENVHLVNEIQENLPDHPEIIPTRELRRA